MIKQHRVSKPLSGRELHVFLAITSSIIVPLIKKFLLKISSTSAFLTVKKVLLYKSLR